MGKHSKNVNTNPHFGYRERKLANSSNWGSITKRVSSQSNLPFGYCSLTMVPTTSTVATPSGHIYEKEAILEYILHHMKKANEEEEEAREEQQLVLKEEEAKAALEETISQEEFRRIVDGVSAREATAQEGAGKRKREIDDSSNDERIVQLSKSSPWLPAFTPSVGETKKAVGENGSGGKKKRASSPFSGRPLRAKDLVPLDLRRDSSTDDSTVRYLCTVSNKVITTQPVVAIKSTHAVMLEEVAQQVAYPTQTCPVTSQKFKGGKADVLVLKSAQTAFAGSGATELTVKRQALI